jgi:hypothetical protein
MAIVANVLIILHLIGMAYLFGSFLVHIKDIVKGQGVIVRGYLDGALLQLVTGIALVGIYSSGALPDEKVNNAVIGIKLLIALAVWVIAFVLRNKKPAPSVALWSIGGLTLVNIILGVTSAMAN